MADVGSVGWVVVMKGASGEWRCVLLLGSRHDGEGARWARGAVVKGGGSNDVAMDADMGVHAETYRGHRPRPPWTRLHWRLR